jgi:hypothetical protein
VSPFIVARQRLGKTFPRQRSIVGGAVFVHRLWSVLYLRKVSDSFFPELVSRHCAEAQCGAEGSTGARDTAGSRVSNLSQDAGYRDLPQFVHTEPPFRSDRVIVPFDGTAISTCREARAPVTMRLLSGQCRTESPFPGGGGGGPWPLCDACNAEAAPPQWGQILVSFSVRKILIVTSLSISDVWRSENATFRGSYSKSSQTGTASR